MTQEITLTQGELPTIEINGHTLTIDLVKQLDTVHFKFIHATLTDREKIIDDFYSHKPVARVRAHRDGIELIGTNLLTGYLVRLVIGANYVLLPNATTEKTNAAHDTMLALTDEANSFPLAVLPKPTATITR